MKNNSSMNLLYSWLGTEKIYTDMEILNIFFQLQVMEIIQNYSIFTFFVFYFFSKRHFAYRNKAGYLVLAHHKHFEPNIGEGFNIPRFKCSELCEYPTSSFR